MSVGRGQSPSSSVERVEKYWDDEGIDGNIVGRNRLLIWERDYYGDELEEIMEEEYGKDWEKIWDDKWKEDIAKREAKREEARQQFKEMIENKKNNE